VVVGIIALLVAVLLPSLSRARSSARGTVCGSNLHQFGLVMMYYEMDNRNYIPRGGTVASQHWVMLVAKYLGAKQKFNNVEQVPVEKYPLYSCPERVTTLPSPFIDYVINSIPSDLKPGQGWGSEVDVPTPASVWPHLDRILLLGDTAFEKGFATAAEGASTDDELKIARENHPRGMLYVLPDPFDPFTQGSLSRMDFFRPQDLPSNALRRAGSMTHVKDYCNWLYGDNHVEKVKWLNGVRTCEKWIHMFGIIDPLKTCSN